ncbi:hypothetical protein K2173_007007 [Erythroxylum novogranatense]|uniref:Uncharacterized protein n=1 Tax=Erythroxylum novogranatense TaxID=1862640 RepID=A0AAV8TF43_9ROSI|nr:hypothetical protein K2173_007007 [Erythroxylum novogranatense]
MLCFIVTLLDPCGIIGVKEEWQAANLLPPTFPSVAAIDDAVSPQCLLGAALSMQPFLPSIVEPVAPLFCVIRMIVLSKLSLLFAMVFSLRVRPRLLHYAMLCSSLSTLIQASV